MRYGRSLSCAEKLLRGNGGKSSVSHLGKVSNIEAISSMLHWTVPLSFFPLIPPLALPSLILPRDILLLVICYVFGAISLSCSEFDLTFIGS